MTDLVELRPAPAVLLRHRDAELEVVTEPRMGPRVDLKRGALWIRAGEEGPGVTVTHGAATVLSGGDRTYTVIWTITNIGNRPWQGPRLEMTEPAPNSKPAPNPQCTVTFDSKDGNKLDPGESRTFSVTVTVPKSGLIVTDNIFEFKDPLCEFGWKLTRQSGQKRKDVKATGDTLRIFVYGAD